MVSNKDLVRLPDGSRGRVQGEPWSNQHATLMCRVALLDEQGKETGGRRDYAVERVRPERKSEKKAQAAD